MLSKINFGKRNDVIPSAVEGSRPEIFKVKHRDPSQPSQEATARQATYARDDDA
jgi:hypothetical protein